MDNGVRRWRVDNFKHLCWAIFYGKVRRRFGVLLRVVVVAVGGDGGKSAVGTSGIGMGAIVEMGMMR